MEQQTGEWLVVALLTLVVVLAAVLGGVLGSRKSGSAPSPDVVSPEPPKPIDPLTNTGLGATGWRIGEEFVIQLAFQSNDGYIRVVNFSSGAGEWSASRPLVKSRAGTPLSLTSYDALLFGAASVRCKHWLHTDTSYC